MTTSATAFRTATAPTAVFNPFNWLFRLEAAFRQADQLKSTEDHHLRDMGISRKQANQSFLAQFSQNRYYSKSRG